MLNFGLIAKASFRPLIILLNGIEEGTVIVVVVVVVVVVS